MSRRPWPEEELEQLHELPRDLRIARERLVLVLDAVGTAYTQAIRAVCAQDLDLSPCEPGQHHEPTEGVGLRLASPDCRDRLCDPVAALLQIERLPVLSQQAEVVQERLAVLEVQAGRDLLDDRQAEVLEDRDEVRQDDLPSGLVEADPREVLILAALVLEADGERRAVLEALELLYVEDGEIHIRRGLVVVGKAFRVLVGERGAALLPVHRDEAFAETVVPRARERGDLLLELRKRHVRYLAVDVNGEVDPRLLFLAQGEVIVDRGAVEALEEEVLQVVSQLRVEPVAREGDEHRDPPLFDVGPDEELRVLALLQREQRDELFAKLVHARDEQLVFRKRLEQREEGLVVVGVLEEILGNCDLAELPAEDRDAAGRGHVRLAREEPDEPAARRRSPPPGPIRLTVMSSIFARR